MATINNRAYSQPKNLRLKGQGVGRGGVLLIEGVNATSPILSTHNGLYVNDSNQLVFSSQGSATVVGAAGGAGSTLDSAYDAGRTIAVNAGPVILAGANQDTATLNITADAASGGPTILIANSGSGNDITGSASTWSITAAGAATLTAIDMQDNELITFGTGNDATIGWDASKLAITGVVDFANNVTLAASATITQTGAGGSTVYTITAGDVVYSDSSLAITDADNAETVTVINNTATTIGAAATAGVVQIESTSLTTGAALNVQLTEGTLNGGFYYSAWDATAGARVFSVAEDGATTIAGAGGNTVVTVTAGDIVASDGSLAITDADNAETVTIINNTATTIGASATAGVVQIESTSLTTGAALNVQLTEGTLNGGWYYSAWDATGGTRVFSVGENGLTTIEGSASGTDALVITAGDLLITSGHADMTVGDLTLADGSVSITDADNANSLVVVNNTITTADLVSVASTSISTGALVKLNANTDAHDGEVLEIISSGDTTSTPVGVSVTIAEPTTGAARGVDITMVGATTGPIGLKITMDAITESSMVYLDNGGASLTTGYYINCNDDGAVLFSVGAAGAVVEGTVLFKDFTEVVAAENTITASESGSVFFLNDATEFDSILPAPAAGLHFTFIVSAAPSGANYTITSNSAANIIKGTVHSSTGGDADSETSGCDTINFVASAAVAGDTCELWCDGTNWFAKCFSDADGGVTFTTAA